MQVDSYQKNISFARSEDLNERKGKSTHNLASQGLLPSRRYEDPGLCEASAGYAEV